MKKRFFAFTLAEVLITLGIIGVVAAMTLPNLIANYQKQVFVNQLKKSVNIVEQGFRKRMADIDVTDLSYGGITEMYDPDVFQTEMRKTFHVLSTCIMDDNCVPKDPKTKKAVKYKSLKGNASVFDPKAFYLAVLTDGTFIGFREHFCGFLRNSQSSSVKNNCGFVIIDVNGVKGPNQYGRDVFYFMLGNTGNLYPMYGDEWSIANFGNTDHSYKSMPEYCTPTAAQTSGEGCAAKIMDDGWVMKY